MKCFSAVKIWMFTAVLQGVFLCCSCAAKGPVDITILQTTDLHGAKQFASLAQVIRQERQKDPELLLIDCGDTVRGAFETSVDGGTYMVGMMNLLKYDAWIFGNHEFRIGQKLQRKNAEAFKGDILASNLVYTKEGVQPDRPILPWKIYKRKGVKIAVIGMLTPYYDYWFNTAAYQNIRLNSPKEVLAEIMPEIRKQKPDLIVLAAHMNAKSGVEIQTGVEKYVSFQKVLEEYPDICLMMMGHTHGVVKGEKLSPDSMTHLVQPQTHARSLAKIQITYDRSAKKVTGITSELLESKNVSPITDLPGEWENMEKMVKEASEKVLMTLPEEWVHKNPRESAPTIPWFQIIGNAMREALDADASMPFNGKPIRKQNLTALDMYRMIPNETSLSKLTFTPEQLQQLLKDQPQLKKLIYGLDMENLPKRNVSVVFDAYDVTGCDGAYPALRIIAGKVPRVDSLRNIRESLTEYLMKHYPAVTGDAAPKK